ncbi:hypothetical protein Pla144_22180 [Bythopirellula polymerisocia]|uniref:Uncharacterized protein n=1 Tax=Bythopirellula polymerisocia TaxID=2528003 RepID=A0A5C6CUA7_9BACT|nr:hypothetical protein Pla144_22180 [Bythopirellula polymerisocia]
MRLNIIELFGRGSHMSFAKKLMRQQLDCKEATN